MTVQSQTSRVSYAGAGTTGPFAVPFYFLEDAHLQVIRRSAAGVETTLTLNTDYTVTGAGLANGGEVNTIANVALGETLAILRNVPMTQLVDYVRNDPFPETTHELALDKLTMIVQQLKERLDRALTIPATDDSSDLDDLIAGVLTLLGIVNEITTVAGISTHVTTVAGINEDVVTVSTINAAVSTLADIETQIVALAARDEELVALGARTAEIDALYAELSTIAEKVNKSGDTMTGFLVLHADPEEDMQAATKQYVDNKPSGRASPLDEGAVGDGDVDDSAAVDAAAMAFGTVYLPVTYTFNYGAAEPAFPVAGPGELKVDGEIYSGFEPVAYPDRSSICFRPTAPDGLDWLYEDFPTSSNHGNTLIGSGVTDTGDANFVRTTVVGGLALAKAEVSNRVEAIGQGSLRNARFAQRCTMVGTLTAQWLGQLVSSLPSLYHDMYWPTLPSDGAWDFDGIETSMPGTRALIAALDDDDAATTSDDVLGNVGIGRDALCEMLKGVDNTSVGYKSLSGFLIGTENVAFGNDAGRRLVFGDENTFIGNAAGEYWVNVDGCVLIGNDAGRQQTIGNNKFILQNKTGRQPLMRGEFHDTTPTLQIIANTEISGQVLAAGSRIATFSRAVGGAVSLQVSSRGTGSAGANAAAACVHIHNMETTNRSINAGGTINASGADYAEYREVMPHLYGKVARGAMLGLAAEGLLTDRWSDIVGRVFIKSTAPNLVGNDQWGTEEAICAKYGVDAPGEEPRLIDPLRAKKDHESQKLYDVRMEKHALEMAEARAAHDLWAARKEAFEAALESERRKWDRVAMCGLVPCNVEASDADIGKYLVPVEGASGELSAAVVAEADLTLKDYIRSFGVVEAIGDDGRPLVSVKIA